MLILQFCNSNEKVDLCNMHIAEKFIIYCDVINQEIPYGYLTDAP